MYIDLLEVFRSVATDIDLDPCTVKYCVRRIKSEGLKFLTVTLPKLSKAVLRSLELGYFDRPTDFAWKGGALLHFRVILSGIFDLKTGQVLNNVNADSLKNLRQLCDYFYKLALPYDEKDIDSATEKFLSTEAELSVPFDKSVAEQARKDFSTYMPSVSNNTVCDVFKHAKTVRPGPGTFSEWQKYGPWYARKYFDESYPSQLAAYKGYFRYLKSSACPEEDVLDPTYSEVLFVPKDSRGPRTIVREPFSLLKAQMAFFDWLSSSLESVSNIRFYDQQPNRSAALSSSVDKKYATVDLKEASDRVRYDVAMHVFRNSPAISYFLNNCRTKYTKLPNGTFHKLLKVSGMGSGLTFPLMSLLIYLVSVRAVADFYSKPFDHVKKHVSTYGDDLIVPVHALPLVKSRLRAIGLEINNDKTFSKSHFRESCGGDYYAGQDVTPVRLKLQNASPTVVSSLGYKSPYVIDISDAGLFQLTDHCKELQDAKMYETADYFYRNIEIKRGIKLPYIGRESSVLGRYTTNSRDVLSQIKMDTFGNVAHVNVRVLKCKEDKEFKLSESSYNMMRKLRSIPISWFESLLSLKGSSVDSVTIPRKTMMKRVSKHAFALL